MKKCISLLLAVLLLLCSACAGGEKGPVKKKHITDDAVRYGTIAMETMEDYLDGKIELKAAQDKLKNCASKLKDTGDTFDNILSINISVCSTNLYLHSVGNKSKAEIREDIQDINDFLYE